MFKKICKRMKPKGCIWKELHIFFTNLKSCMRNLTTLDVEMSTKRSLLIPISKDSFLEDLSMMFSRKFGAEIWTMVLMKRMCSIDLKI